MDNPVYEKLVNASLRFVSFRPRSEKEFREFLKKKSPGDSVEKVIERMRELGYVNDQKFAQWWVQQRSTFRPKGKRALEYELRKKGVSVDLKIDEYEMAQKAMKKNPSNPASFLSSRGFSYDVIRRIIDEMVEKD